MLYLFKLHPGTIPDIGYTVCDYEDEAYLKLLKPKRIYFNIHVSYNLAVKGSEKDRKKTRPRADQYKCLPHLASLNHTSVLFLKKLIQKMFAKFEKAFH